MIRGLILAVTLAVLAACTVPVQPGGKTSLTDVSRQTQFSHLKAMAYMGGSLYFDPNHPAESALVSGAKVGIRLGHTNRTDVDSERAVFNDIPSEARFGLFVIGSIGTDAIELTYDLYDLNGRMAGSGTARLARGESADLDADGQADLSYAAPTRPRGGLEAAVFLTFVSSQEANTTSMFALIPQQYPDGDYPNGLLGINSDGKFLVSKYRSASDQRSVSRGIQFGDFVLDRLQGHYERVVRPASRGGQSRSVDDGELEGVSASVAITYEYRAEEFSEAQTIPALLAALPEGVRGAEAVPTAAGPALERLNQLLGRADLIPAFLEVQSGPIPDDALPGVLETLPTLTNDQVVQLNRLYVEKSYPALSPAFAMTENPLSEVLPLMSCLIRNPDAPEEVATTNASLSTRALTESEYDSRSKDIVDNWKKFFPVVHFTNKDIMNTISGFFSPQSASTSSGGTSSGSNGGSPSSTPKGPKFSPFEEFVISTAKNLAQIPYTPPDQVESSSLLWKLKTDADGYFRPEDLSKINYKVPELSDFLTVDVGLYGWFTCTWGNIEGGTAVAAFVHADTELTVGANANSTTAGGDASAYHTMDPLPINLRLFGLPPIQIGVVTLTFALDGGFSLPVGLGFSAKLSSGVRFAFTGMFGAKAYVGANYGVVWKKYKVLWWTVKLPVVSLDPYAKGELINDAAYYAGPTSFVINKSLPTLDAASAKFTITPSVYLEPKIIFNDSLWIGARGTIGEELKFEMTTKNVANRWYPDIHGVGTATFKASVDAKGGISVVVPIVNYRWEPSMSFTVWKGEYVNGTWKPF